MTVRKQCGAMQPTPTAMTDYVTCYCSRPVGHDGEHRSWLVNGQVIGIWPADDASDPQREPQPLREVLPDVLDQLTETAAARRVHPHHTTTDGDERHG